MTVHLATESDTFDLGVALGRSMFEGAVLALMGELGAGKTLLVRGIAASLGHPGPVPSPSFGLLHVHRGGRRVPLYHADFYRLTLPSEAEALGLFELAADGVLAIEWADRFPELLPDDRLDIVLRDAGLGRDAELRATGPLHRPLEAVGG